jgi:hypothetical protein
MGTQDRPNAARGNESSGRFGRRFASRRPAETLRISRDVQRPAGFCEPAYLGLFCFEMALDAKVRWPVADSCDMISVTG